MKKIFFLFAMLASVAVSATVTITPISTDYSTKKITFKVEWTNTPIAPYNNRVWIWIDFCPVNGVAPQSFSTATITSLAKTGGNGTITNITTRGFFIEYGATNAGTTVTATLSNAPSGKFNWCAYGSDYPPNVTLDKGTYTFKGTTNFIVNSHAQPITTKTIAKTNLTVTSSSTFTDATGCPGIGSLYCPYTGSDLYMDATHLCQQRTAGAKNWEAWIKDTRDNEYYRIVLMPDSKWWLAQNLKYATSGAVLFQSCGKDSCGRFYSYTEVFNGNYAANSRTICPIGWVLPSNTQWNTMTTSISSSLTTAWRDLRSLRTGCSPITDRYGWAAKGKCPPHDEFNDGDTWYSTTGSAAAWASIDQGDGNKLWCDSNTFWLNHYDTNHKHAVRCLRP
jgi:uncharacterized protein (TIGR02145 family)